jgi:transcriptional regulator with XRE-family HTH domain
MLSNYGRILRKMRIDNAELLNTMATRLEISPAYLSSIENSERPIPQGFSEKIATIYHLKEIELAALKKAEDETLKTIELQLPTEIDSRKRQTALVFARTFNNISNEELEKIRAILTGGDTESE